MVIPQPFDEGALIAKMEAVIATVATAAAEFPPAALLIAALGQIAPAGVHLVAWAFRERIIRPLTLASINIDAKYQAAVLSLIDMRSGDLMYAAVKDIIAAKLGVGSEAFFVDHGELGRVDDMMLQIFLDSGMPIWMAYCAASDFSWYNDNGRRAADDLDIACERLNIASNHSTPVVLKAGYKSLSELPADIVPSGGSGGGAGGDSSMLILGGAALVALYLVVRK